MKKFKVYKDNGQWHIDYKDFIFYRKLMPKTFKTPQDALQFLEDAFGYEKFAVNVEDENNVINLF